jgi:murein DD-endopeptidase MepM/ murein hydrolase activator NlpD
LTDLLRWGSVIFPERKRLNLYGAKRVAALLRERRSALLGTVAAVGVAALLRERRTVLLGTVAAVGVATAFGLGALYVSREHSAARQTAIAARQERANADLQDVLAQMRDEVGATNQQLRLAQQQIAALSRKVEQQAAASQQAASSKSDRIAQLAQALDAAQRELHLTEAQRATLMARLSMTEAQQARQQRAAAQGWQQKVEQLTADRDRAARERDTLRARLNALQQRLSRSRTAAASLAAAQPTARPEASGSATHQRQIAVIEPGRTEPIIAAERPVLSGSQEEAPAPTEAVAGGRLGEIKRVLASAGVDVKRMFADLGNKSGLGGPFVAMSPGAMAANRVSAVKLAALPGLFKSLPTGEPMYNYRETSPFGERTDPFNGRSAFHPGVDLAAPYGTPVYATAAGVVTFAGWSGGYGRIVEVSHGHGIVSRYGHLARSTVLVGEQVKKGAQIGYEGSTGRSTGPHVIYEIDVNGEPQDPAKFMGLARLLPAVER